jgi:tetratricopeptide (TPR) repeat protein
LLLAMLYDRAGRMADAGTQYHAAVAAKPDYFKGLLNLGGWHFRQGEFQQAADCFARAIDVEPKNPAGYVQRGRALLEVGDATSAAPLLKQALQLDPYNTVTLRAFAWLLSIARESELRDGAQAMQLLKQLPPDPQQQDVWRLDVLAAALAETGDFPAALKTIQIATLRAAEQNRPAALQQQLSERAACYARGEPWRLRDTAANHAQSQ